MGQFIPVGKANTLIMAETFKQYNIFIASPGDVAEEREIIRQTCSKLNSNPLVEGKEFHLKALGREDEIPGAFLW